MTYEQFGRALKAGDIGRVYAFSGPEQYVKESALAALRKRLLPEGLEALNENMLAGDVPAAQIIEAAETLPMLCERRLVLVRDWAPMLAGRAKNEAENGEQIARWLPNAPASCCLVFLFDNQPDARKRASKALQQCGVSVAFPLLGDAELARWLNRPLKALGKELTRPAAERLIFMAGRSLTALHREVEKLSAYVGARAQIMPEDVEAIVTPSVECTVFQMIDALIGGDMPRAQLLSKAMLEVGETRIGILAMLTRQTRMLTHLRTLRDEGMPLSEIERRLELNHYAASRTAAQAGRFQKEALAEAYRACVETDYAIKSGRARDAAALDRLMLVLGNLAVTPR